MNQIKDIKIPNPHILTLHTMLKHKKTHPFPQEQNELTIPQLAESLKSPEPSKRLQAVMLLGKRKVEETGDVVPLLREAMNDNDLVVQFGVTLATESLASSFEKLPVRPVSEPKAEVDAHGQAEFKFHPLHRLAQDLVAKVCTGDDPISLGARSTIQAMIDLGGMEKPEDLIKYWGFRGMGLSDEDSRKALEKLKTAPIDDAEEFYKLAASIANESVRAYNKKHPGKPLSEFRPIDLQLHEDSIKLRDELPKFLQAARRERKFSTQKLFTTWSERLHSVVEGLPSPASAGKNCLAMYGAMTDYVMILDNSNIQDFLSAAVERAVVEGVEGGDKSRVIDHIKKMMNTGEGLEKDIEDSAQVAATILRAMKTQKFGKSGILDSKSEEKIRGLLKASGIEPREVPGGGAANDALNIPREKATIHTQNNHPNFGRTLKGTGIKRLMFDDGHNPLFDREISSDEAVNEGDVDRYSYVLQVMIGTEVNGIAGVDFAQEDKVKTKSTDRHILAPPISSDFKPYMMELAGLGEPEKMEKLREIGGHFGIVLVNGMHYLKTPEDKAEMVAQIRGLREGGALTHCPLSRVKRGVDMSYLTDVLKGNIHSIGMDHKEVGVAAEYLEEHGLMEADRGDKPINIFNNALRVARALDVDRVHIHGSEFDLVIRRGASERDMEKEVLGGIYGKYAMVPKLVEGFARPDYKVYPNVKLEGLEAMAQLSGEIADSLSLRDEEKKDFAVKLLMDGRQDLGGGWSIALFPPKYIYDQRRIRFPTGAGDGMETNSAVYGFMGV